MQSGIYICVNLRSRAVLLLLRAVQQIVHRRIVCVVFKFYQHYHTLYRNFLTPPAASNMLMTLLAKYEYLAFYIHVDVYTLLLNILCELINTQAIMLRNTKTHPYSLS